MSVLCESPPRCAVWQQGPYPGAGTCGHWFRCLFAVAGFFCLVGLPQCSFPPEHSSEGTLVWCSAVQCAALCCGVVAMAGMVLHAKMQAGRAVCLSARCV